MRVYAAGSLAGAFNALLDAFGTPPGEAAQPTYGPSGLLRGQAILARHGLIPVALTANWMQPQP